MKHKFAAIAVLTIFLVTSQTVLLAVTPASYVNNAIRTLKKAASSGTDSSYKQWHHEYAPGYQLYQYTYDATTEWDDTYGTTSYTDTHWWTETSSGSTRYGYIDGVFYDDTPIDPVGKPQVYLDVCNFSEEWTDSEGITHTYTYQGEVDFQVSTGAYDPGKVRHMVVFLTSAYPLFWNNTSKEVELDELVPVNWKDISVNGEPVLPGNYSSDFFTQYSLFNTSINVNSTQSYRVMAHFNIVPDTRTVTAAYHPEFVRQSVLPDINTWRVQFYQGSKALAEDNDYPTVYEDTDPVVDPDPNNPHFDPDVYGNDDVFYHLDFATFWSDPVDISTVAGYQDLNGTYPIFSDYYGVNYGELKYYVVTDWADMQDLFNYAPAYIKIVNSIELNQKMWDGFGIPAPQSIVMKKTTPTLTSIHEWCHTMGLNHRGDPGTFGDPDNALMAPTSQMMGPEINRHERDNL